MKNKKLKPILISIILLFVLIACNESKFLDVYPKGVVIAKTASDFRKLLDDSENQSLQYSLSQSVGMLDVLSDDVSIDSTVWNSWTTTQMHFQELYTFKDYVWVQDGLKNDFNWNKNYYISSVIASILLEIEKVTDNEELKNQLIAEAKVHRAYAYFMLVNCYATAYDPETASTDLGVPIVTQPAALPSLERKTVQEVYDFILSDLTEESIANLPDDVDQYKHRPTKVSAYAILARVYLYMGDYENALFYANKSLAIRNFLYDFNTQYTGDYPYYSKIAQISLMNDEEMLLYKTTPRNSPLLRSYSYMIIDSSSFNKIYSGYSFDGTNYENYDLRRTLWFYGWNSTTVRMTTKYLKYYGNHYNYRYKIDGSSSSYTANIHPTTGEMYVTRAECNARLGSLQEALDDINTVGVNRYKTGTYTDITLADLGNSQEAVLDAVLKERRRELYGKELRLFDIKRLHLPVTHSLSSLKISVPADDSRFVLPILDYYIDLNPEIEQNDRSNSGVVYEETY